MSDALLRIKEKQKRRRELLAKQLGVEHPSQIKKALTSKLEQEEIADRRKRKANPSKEKSDYDQQMKRARSDRSTSSTSQSSDHKSSSFESISANVYSDSSTFLKGTQSLNPHNDYCQNYVDTGQRPQNYIRDVGLTDRFEEYPKLKDLNLLKDELIRKTNTPPMYLRCDLDNYDIRELGSKFEVILIQPPLEEYRRQAGFPADSVKTFSWNDIMALEIEEISAPRSFVFLWCGSSDGLDSGRQCLKKWGFRRCEDICWIKTNFKKKNPKYIDQGALFSRTKEHCLMGIKGTVRRSIDGDFIHANVDIDLIIDEEQELGNEDKPEEIFHLIEHFCLSRRRLHLFGRDSSIRPGWLTVGPGLTNSNFDAETYRNYFKVSDENASGILTGCTDEIERLRPKTPPPRDKSERGSHHSGRGRGTHSSGPSKDMTGGKMYKGGAFQPAALPLSGDPRILGISLVNSTGLEGQPFQGNDSGYVSNKIGKTHGGWNDNGRSHRGMRGMGRGGYVPRGLGKKHFYTYDQ